MRWHSDTYTVPNNWAMGFGGVGQEGVPRTIREWTQFARLAAQSMGAEILATFDQCLQTLKDFDSQSGTEMCIFTDFAPLSFTWTWVRPKRKTCDLCYKPFRECPDCHGTGYVDETKTLLMGGMIFHGNHDGNGDGSAPTLCVSLGQASPGWSIHT